jgi:hypothetical protein
MRQVDKSAVTTRFIGRRLVRRVQLSCQCSHPDDWDSGHPEQVPTQGSVGQNPYVKQKLRLVLPLTVSLVVIGATAFVIWSVATASGPEQTNIAMWATVLTAIALVPPCCFGFQPPAWDR